MEYATDAVLRDVETKQFSFFHDCGEIVIINGVFIQKNVLQVVSPSCCVTTLHKLLLIILQTA